MADQGDAAQRTATVIVARRAAPGREAECERWMRKLRRAAARAPGYIGSTFHPPQDAHPGEWLVVYSFASQPLLEAWLESPVRRELIEESEAFIVDGVREQRVAEGPSKTITLVSSVRLRPGTEAAHRELHERGVDRARSIGGLIRAELLPAVEGVQPETVALLTFDSRQQLDAWLGSDVRRDMLEEMVPLTVGDRTVNVVGGFAGWFADHGTGEPKRWKQAVAVIVALVPISLLVTAVRTAVAPDLPVAVAVTLAAIVNVIILTWLVMPAVTRLLSRWLGR